MQFSWTGNGKDNPQCFTATVKHPLNLTHYMNTAATNDRCQFSLNSLEFLPCGANDVRVIAIIMCPSVCVCVTRRYCIKRAKRRITQTTPRDSPGTLVFWHQESLVDDQPSPWNLRSNWPTPFWTPNVGQISAHSASTVKAGEKVQLALIGSGTCAFQRAINKPCTLTLSPPKGSTKRDFAVFASKIQLLSKTVCCKVSLCKNFKQQCCSHIISVSNGP